MKCCIRLLLGLSIWLTCAAALAAELTWTVQGGTFADGGTLAGSFVVDPQRPVPLTWNLNVAGGGGSFPARAYNPANSGAFSILNPSDNLRLYWFRVTGVSPSPAPRELRMTPSGPLDGSVASVPFSLINPNGNVECYNCSPFRLLRAGSLALTSATPELILESITPDPTTVGAVTTATVSMAAFTALGPPTGTISVLDSDNNLVCQITLPALSCPFTPTTVGGQTLTAQYTGDSNYSVAISNALSFTVMPATPTTVILQAVTPNPTAVTVATTATVLVETIPALGPPTGIVTVLDGSSNSLCTITLPATSCVFAPPMPGAQTIIAQYSGNASYASGTSNELPLTVGPVPANLTLVSVTPDSTVVGETITATVSLPAVPPFGPPTGTVTVFDGSNNTLCTITLPGASCTFAPTAPGSLTVAARYNADTYYEGALSNELLLDVVGSSGDATTVILQSVAPNPTSVTEPTTATVLVEEIAALGLPTGMVTVQDGDGHSLCTITLPGASCVFTPTAIGDLTIVAQYSGNGSYASATSNTLPLTVAGSNGGATTSIPTLPPLLLGLLALALTAVATLRQSRSA